MIIDVQQLNVDMMIDASAAITLSLWKNDQALNGIRTQDLCVTDAMLSQLTYQNHMRAVGLALYIWAFIYEFHGNRCPTVAIKCKHDDSCE